MLHNTIVLIASVTISNININLERSNNISFATLCSEKAIQREMKLFVIDTAPEQNISYCYNIQSLI